MSEEQKVKPTNTFGLDVELAAIREASYDHEAEELAEQWITDLTGLRKESKIGFGSWLQDGTVLCTLVNTVKNSSVDTQASNLLISIPKINQVANVKLEAKKKGLAMDNITQFIAAVRALGVPDYSNFSTETLLNLKDIGQVVKCIHAYSNKLKQLDLFAGPFIETRKVVPKNFTDENQENDSDDDVDSLD
eukprot:maker-scaffold_19-snap-gene-3.8-mRNA-1 protein AED:0.00 eAED:0.00 QI:189/1/1/1/1/1/2/24/190